MNIKYAERIKWAAQEMYKTEKRKQSIKENLKGDITIKRRRKLMSDYDSECLMIEKCTDWISCLLGHNNPDDLRDTYQTSEFHEYPYIKEQIKRFMEENR